MPNLNIGQIGGLFRNLGGQVSRLVDRDVYGAAKRAGIPLRRAVKGDLSRREAARTIANSRIMQGAVGFTGLGGLGSFTENIENSLEQVAPAIDRAVSNVVPDNIENWAGRTAREMEKGGFMNLNILGALIGAAQTYNQTGGYNTVQRPLGTKSRLGGNEVSWKGDNLGWQRTYSEGVSPPSFTPVPPRDLNNGWQAGQTGSNMIPPGAGVLAERPDVTNRPLSQEVLNAAQQFSAPANVPLPAFYEGQQQLGRSMMQNGTLVSQLQELGGARGMTPENLKTWATANPALAYRELLKRRGVQ
jgi:hypothetical protein